MSYLEIYVAGLDEIRFISTDDLKDLISKSQPTAAGKVIARIIFEPIIKDDVGEELPLHAFLAKRIRQPQTRDEIDWATNEAQRLGLK